MSILHHGRNAIIRTAYTAPDGCPCVQKLWHFWKPQQEVDLEITTHTAAAAAGVAPQIYDAGRTGGKQPQLYITMPRLDRNFQEFCREENEASVTAALADIRELYATLDRAGVVHNDGDPRNVRVNANGRWFLIDFGRARMREVNDGRHYNVNVTYNIMAVRASQKPVVWRS